MPLQIFGEKPVGDHAASACFEDFTNMKREVSESLANNYLYVDVQATLTLLMGTCNIGQVVIMYEVIAANVGDFIILVAEHILAPKMQDI